MSQQQPNAAKIESMPPGVADGTTPSELQARPEVSVIDLATVQKPGQVCLQLLSANQTAAPTIIIATSREVAAGINRIAKRPIKEVTPTGAVPYRLSQGITVDTDRLIVQDVNMERPDVELVAGEGTTLNWDNTSVTLPPNEEPTQLPEGVCTAREEDGQWIIETLDGASVRTVNSREELDESHTVLKDWVCPTQVSYRHGISLYFAVQQNADQLREHTEPTTDQPQDSVETLEEFIHQATVESAGDSLECSRVLEAFNNWLGADRRVSKAAFTKRLQHTAWETVEITSELGRQRMIQDHTWRYIHSN